MKKTFLFKIGLLLLLLLSLLGCEEKTGVATLRLKMNPYPQGVRTLSPEGQGLTITGYTVSGEGPNDATFSVSTNSSQIEINSLTIGTWELEVIGYNQQGTPIAQKTLSHHLTSRNNFLEVVLTDLVGEGGVDIGFYWSEVDFPDIAFVLELKSQGGSYEVVESGVTINPATASARYQATLPCGSYEIAFSLFSQDEKLAGGVEALRILDNCSTSGNITIVINKETAEPTGLRILSNIVEPVEGLIEGLPDVIPPNTETTVSFTRTRGGGAKNLQIAWYIDGSYRGDSNPFSFSTHTGTHRIDALVQTELLGSVGTVSKTFRASFEATDGEPYQVFSVSDGDKDSNENLFWLTNLKDIKFLHDGRLLLASSKGLQLCEIRRDSLQVVNTFTSSGGDVNIDQYPTAGVTNIVVDPFDNIICTTAKELGIMVFYRYDAANGNLEKIKAYAPSTNRWSSTTTNTVIDPLFKTYIIVDGGRNRAYYGTYSDLSVTEPMSIPLADYLYPLAAPTSIALSPDGSRLVVTSPSNNSFHSYAVIRDNPIYLGLGIESNSAIPSELGGGPYGAFVLGDLAQLLMEEGLHLFTIGGGVFDWTLVNKIGGGSSYVYDFCFNSALTKEWIIQGESDSVIASMDLFNGTPTGYTASSPLTNFAGRVIDSSPQGNFLAAGSSNQLKLFRISDN